MVADLRYFNSLKHEVDTLKSQLETQKTQFLNEIDRLSREYYYADHMNTILGVYTHLDEVNNLQCDYLETVEKCERLEKELSKSRTMSKSFEALQKHAINLELDLQQCKEKIKNDKSFKENQSNVFLKEREQYFEIQDLKAQLQDKGIAIMVAALDKWKGYLLDRHFKIRTDHFSLKYLLNQKLTTPFQFKWLPKLLGYDYEIMYKTGSENVVADALSRMDSNGEFLQISFSSVSSGVWDKVKDSWKNDLDTQNLIKSLEHHSYKGNKYSWTGEILKRKGKVVVRNDPELRKELGSLIYWKGLKKMVKQMVRDCDVCQRQKPDLSAYPDLIQPLPIPERIWKEISMYFIEKLPTSHGKSMILVVVDRLSKYAHFIPLAHPFTASQIAQVFLDQVYKLHGLPESIVKLKLSTAYHPQTDGHTEVVNRSLGCYPRCMCGEKPKEWIKWLPLAEFWYNTNYHTSTMTTPYEVVYCQTPPIYVPYIPGDSRVGEVDRTLQAREEAIKMLKFHLKRSQDRMRNQANKHMTDRQLEVNDWVYLKLQPHRQVSIRQGQQHKLSSKYYGPFKVAERIREVAYRLELPSSSQIHSVFHISQLKKCHGKDHNPFLEDKESLRRMELIRAKSEVHTVGLEVNTARLKKLVLLAEVSTASSMDWLSNYKAEIICHEKVVSIPLLDGKLLRVLGERLEEKARFFMGAKVGDKKQEEIVVVRDFPKVFLDDLFGLPPIQEIKFQIKLIPGATPIAKTTQGTSKTRHVINGNGIHVDPSKIEAVKNWKAPRTPIEVRLFLRLARYYRRFIQNFSKIAKSLTILTQNGKLSLRKEIVKPTRVRAMNMTLQSSIKDMILVAQKEVVDKFAGLQKGLDEIIISDHDSRFTSRFWQLMQEALGTRLDMNTAYHPQTDGQSEHTIQTLEEMLRACVMDFRGSWDVHLSLVKFPYNNSYLVKKGKLAPRFVGPFKIIKKTCPMAYRLDMREELNGVHDTFHVSNLKKCLADPTLQVPLDEIRVDAKLNFVEEPMEILERYGDFVKNYGDLWFIVINNPFWKIMPPRMRTRSAGRPAAESLEGGTGVWVDRGGRGRRPREGNDERVDDLNGQGNDQEMGANRGVEGVNGNVEGVNGGAPDLSTIIAPAIVNLLRHASASGKTKEMLEIKIGM
ncbi:retrotransposable element Tf2 [Tanacetum coccineum]